MSRLLFVAPAHESWGEFLHGRQIAAQLAGRGHEVTFLVSAPMASLLRGTPCRVGAFGAGPVDDAILAAARETRAELVVLVDATLVFWNLAKARREASFLRRAGAVAALDVWDLARTGLRWDLGDVDWPIPEEAQRIERRLLPVPFAHSGPGAFNALPPVEADGARRAGRERLAVTPDQRVLLLTTAGWQREAFQWLGPQRRSARALPAWVASVLGGLSGDMLVVHLGPERWAPLADRLGERYRYLPQCPPAMFREVMAAADVHLSFNFCARSIAEALRAGVPVVLGQNRFAGTDPDELAAEVGESGELRSWLASAVPLQAFRVWPYGLARFLAPHASDNPYTRAVTSVEILDARAVRHACDELSRTGGARDAALAAATAYVTAVDRLPSGADVLEGWL